MSWRHHLAEDELALLYADMGEKPDLPREPGQYFCPTSGQVEHPVWGGFEVCCEAPERHQPVKERRGVR